MDRLLRPGRRSTDGPVPARSFDPHRVGALECRAWVTYYRQEWAKLLVASVGLVRAAFRMCWPDTLRGAWLILRANQVWAPADNDPARAFMERFYRLVARSAGEPLDTTEAARLEVAWWHAHRVSQHGGTGGANDGDAATAAGGAGPAVSDDVDGGTSHDALVAAVADLYAFVYRVPWTRCGRRRRNGPRQCASRTAGSPRAAPAPARWWRRAGCAGALLLRPPRRRPPPPGVRPARLRRREGSESGR